MQNYQDIRLEKQTIHKNTEAEEVVIDEETVAQWLVCHCSDPLPYGMFQTQCWCNQVM